MKYECKKCGNITVLEITVPLVKCVDCDYVSIYTRKELLTLKEDAYEK